MSRLFGSLDLEAPLLEKPKRRRKPAKPKDAEAHTPGFLRLSDGPPPYGAKVYLIRAVKDEEDPWYNLPKGLVGTIADDGFWDEHSLAAWREGSKMCLVRFENRGTRSVPVAALAFG